MRTQNLSKEKREKLITKIEEIKATADDETAALLNEVENELNRKKYGLVWEEHSEEVEEEMRTKIPVFSEDKDREICLTDKEYNFILEGDNLHSLKLLEKTHKNSIDVIYIDPPYNTGAKNWKYNNAFVDSQDAFRHSKWISMMSRRLTIAKRLLKDAGVLICAIDENEIATLKLLLEDTFGDGYKVDVISIIQNPRGIQGDNFSYTNEYALFVYKKHYKVIGDREIEEDEIDWRELRDNGGESLRSDAKNCFYPIRVKDGEIVGFGDVLYDESVHPKQTEYHPDLDEYWIYPIDVKGIERKYRYARQSVEAIQHLLRVKETKQGGYDIELGKNYGTYRTIWTDKKYDANEYGTKLINNMVPNNDFDFPKSLWNVYECLYATIKNKPDAIVLDFFAGSGTTGHAVEMLNKLVGGNRKYILATNNDVGEKREKEFKKKYGDPCDYPNEFAAFKEENGICTSITYPRMIAAAKGYVNNKDTKIVLYEKKITKTIFKKIDDVKEEIERISLENQDEYESIKLLFENNSIILQGITKGGTPVQGIPHNIKYYKTEFVNKKRDGSVPRALLRHVKELIQLEKHCKIDNKKICIAFTEEEFNAFLNSKINECETLFIASDVLLSAQQAKTIDEHNIELVDIPEYYFSEELREVDEV